MRLVPSCDGTGFTVGRVVVQLCPRRDDAFACASLELDPGGRLALQVGCTLGV